MRHSRLFGRFVMIVALLGFLVASSAVYADRATGLNSSKGETTAKEDHAEKVNLTDEFRRSIFGIDPAALSIHTFIVFCVLLYILGKYAWPKIIEGLDKREQTIADEHNTAKSAREEAQKFLAEIQAERAKTNQEVRLLVEEARRDAQKLKDTLKAEAAAEIQQERDRMKREIEIAKDQALDEIYKKTVELASLVSTKAVRRELTPADHSRLLEESLSEIAGKLTKA